MAERKRSRVGDHNPNIEIGDVLDGIADQEVEIASVAFDTRNGRNGEYTLSIVTLTDGKIYHTGSKVVAERLANVPLSEFPVAATFHLQPSVNNPRQSYWTVS